MSEKQQEAIGGRTASHIFIVLGLGCLISEILTRTVDPESSIFRPKILLVVLGVSSFLTAASFYGQRNTKKKLDLIEEKEAKEVKNKRKDQIRIQREEERLDNKQKELSKLENTLLALQQAGELEIKNEAKKIIDTTLNGIRENAIPRFANQINNLKNRALVIKKDLEKEFKNYKTTLKSSPDQLREKNDKFKTTYPAYKEKLSEIGGELNTTIKLSEECDRIIATLEEKINKDPYAITRKDCSNFADRSGQLANIINKNATLLKLIPEVTDTQKRCADLLKELQGESRKIIEEKKKSQRTSNFFDEHSLLSRWNKAKTAATISKQQLSGEKLKDLSNRIAKAETCAQEIELRIKAIEQFQSYMQQPLEEIDSAEIGKITDQIEEITKFVETEELELYQFQKGLPKQEDPLNANDRKKNQNRSSAQSQFEQNHTFFANAELKAEDKSLDRLSSVEAMIAFLESDENTPKPELGKDKLEAKKPKEKDEKGKKKKMTLPEAADMAERLLEDKDSILDDPTLRYYRYIALIHVSVQNILKMEKELPSHFTSDPAWKRIQNIYYNLTQNPGILRQYSWSEDIRTASEELIKMIRKASQGKTFPGAFNSPESVFLKELMTNTNPVKEEPPYTGGEIPVSSDKTPLSHRAAIVYLRKHIFNKDRDNSATFTTPIISS